MQLRARLSAVSGKAASSADAPNKISLKFDPLFLGDADASWLFDHLGQFVDIELAPSMVPRTPLEDAIDGAR
jgi:hypothetical protein